MKPLAGVKDILDTLTGDEAALAITKLYIEKRKLWALSKVPNKEVELSTLNQGVNLGIDKYYEALNE